MTEPIIEIKKISKKYNIKHRQGGYVALRDVIANVAKSPFKFFKHKAKVMIGKESEEEFWALKDISFNIEKGDTIGVIGHNGAGKSTLLKILTGITPPTEGEIIMRGRVASLLEVGTGFHPELTGRENIFLNGAILGMSKKEIVEKFDEIVKFSGVEKFLDTPVKRYSSGMYVRLAFSVAAHMEPDILLVDEVLAVGDAEFQKKCLGKMNEVTRKSGRTIIFVSHNMEAIKRLCNKCILLENGQMKKIGKSDEVIKYYLSNGKKQEKKFNPAEYLLSDGRITKKIIFSDISITNENGESIIRSDNSLNIRINYKSGFEKKIDDIRVLISIISEKTQRMVMRLDSHCAGITLDQEISGSGSISCETEAINLVEGRYNVEILILPQKTKNDRITLESFFDVVTDNSKYNYRLNPETKLCEYLIRYTFKNN